MNEHDAIHELLTLAAAGALDAGEQGRVEEHLRQCEACRTEFAGWLRLTGALKELPTPQAPPRLLEQTRRAMEMRAEAQRAHRTNHFMLGLMLLFAWTATLLNWPLLRLLEGRLTQWLDVSSGQLTAMWVGYILLAWMATALAAGLLGHRRQREGVTA
ncbi:MAG TPA: zf-HC2 domain-containing protein [Candidatus Angelobacter sp.]